MKRKSQSQIKSYQSFLLGLVVGNQEIPGSNPGRVCGMTRWPNGKAPDYGSFLLFWLSSGEVLHSFWFGFCWFPWDGRQVE